MTRDEILDVYEDLWREAALKDRGQFRFKKDGLMFVGDGDWTCAVAIVSMSGGDLDIKRAADNEIINVRCPHCDEHLAGMGYLMVHLNNEHDWTWDMFANKFRDLVTR